MIPKRIAFFWGESHLSWMRYMTLSSFRKLNPSWEIRLYSCETGQRRWRTWETLDAQDYTGPDYSSRLSELNLQVSKWVPPLNDLSPTHASDLFRWDYLSKDGGWYSDMDILWVKPLDILYRETRDQDVISFETCGVIGFGLLAGSTNMLWRNIYQAALAGYTPNTYHSVGSEAIRKCAGSDDWQTALKNLRKQYASLRIDVLPSSIVYPWSCKQVERIFETTETVPTDCIGIHWFGGHPLSQKWNNQLTDKTCSEFHSTFTKYAQL